MTGDIWNFIVEVMNRINEMRNIWIVLPPEDQHSRLVAAKTLMPAVIEGDIRLIVVKKIELNCRGARRIEEQLVHRVRIRGNSVGVCDAMCVLEYCRVFGQEIAYGLLGPGFSLGTERLHRIECSADTFPISILVLNDNALNSIRMF